MAWDSMLRPGTQLLAFLLAKFASEMAESEGFDKPAGLPRGWAVL